MSCTYADDVLAFGRRPVILICLAILCATSVWAGEANSYNSLLAARLFQGIGGGAADTLAPDVVGQIFFVHQRGRAMVSQQCNRRMNPLS
jgi:MFS family permease